VKFVLAIVVALFLSPLSSEAALIWTYDFPGPGPNNGSAANQTNPQPSGATFSDFTRNGGLIGTGNANVFGSTNWSTSATMDPTVFTAFTITADAGSALDLNQLTFDSLKTGATTAGFTAEVALYLNGSTSPYAFFGWTPQNAPLTSYTFNFGPLTPADNVTTATFKFYGWNATDSTNGLQFANVAVYGTIAAVPEIPAHSPVFLLLICIIALCERRRARKLFRATIAALTIRHVAAP